MRISIPKPCNENWNEMSPEQQGAFCNVCSKVVVDFSNMSDEEVLNYFEKKKGEKTCGRFRVSQISPYEFKINLRAVAAQRSFPKFFAASLFIFFSSLFICKSDTGEPMGFNVVPVDTFDTSSLVLRMDSTQNTIPTTIAPIDSSNSHPIIMGGALVVPVVQMIDTVRLMGDTVITPVIPDKTVPLHPPMMMGKVACTKPQPVIEQTNKPIKQKPVDRRLKGEVKIMGDLEF